MKIEFDPDKDKANIDKHGVSLAFAADVMADPHRVEILDLRFDYGEDRWAVFGMVEVRYGRGSSLDMRLHPTWRVLPRDQREEGQ